MSTLSEQDKITIGCLAASIGVTAIILVVTICQFSRYRRNEKKKLEEDRKVKERRGLQWMSRDVPYRLGEDAIPSMYPDYPGYRDYPVDYPTIDIVEEYPVDYPEPRGRFFPVDETPYPMRPCIEPPMNCDCDPEPEQRIIFEPVTPHPPPPPDPPKIVVYQPLPRDPTPLPPPPPRTEVIREIYFPSQPQQPPPPPRERRGSWCGPSNDDWILVKKEVKKAKPKKKKKKVTRRVEDSDDDDSANSSSSEEEETASPYNRRLMPYDLAMPRLPQFPRPPTLMPVQPIYFVPQQQQQPTLIPAPLLIPTPTLAPTWK